MLATAWSSTVRHRIHEGISAVGLDGQTDGGSPGPQGGSASSGEIVEPPRVVHPRRRDRKYQATEGLPASFNDEPAAELTKLDRIKGAHAATQAYGTADKGTTGYKWKLSKPQHDMGEANDVGTPFSSGPITFQDPNASLPWQRRKKLKMKEKRVRSLPPSYYAFRNESIGLPESVQVAEWMDDLLDDAESLGYKYHSSNKGTGGQTTHVFKHPSTGQSLHINDGPHPTDKHWMIRSKSGETLHQGSADSDHDWFLDRTGPMKHKDFTKQTWAIGKVNKPAFAHEAFYDPRGPEYGHPESHPAWDDSKSDKGSWHPRTTAGRMTGVLRDHGFSYDGAFGGHTLWSHPKAGNVKLNGDKWEHNGSSGEGHNDLDASISRAKSGGFKESRLTQHEMVPELALLEYVLSDSPSGSVVETSESMSGDPLDDWIRYRAAELLELEGTSVVVRRRTSIPSAGLSRDQFHAITQNATADQLGRVMHQYPSYQHFQNIWQNHEKVHGPAPQQFWDRAKQGWDAGQTALQRNKNTTNMRRSESEDKRPPKKFYGPGILSMPVGVIAAKTLGDQKAEVQRIAQDDKHPWNAHAKRMLSKHFNESISEEEGFMVGYPTDSTQVGKIMIRVLDNVNLQIYAPSRILEQVEAFKFFEQFQMLLPKTPMLNIRVMERIAVWWRDYANVGDLLEIDCTSGFATVTNKRNNRFYALGTFGSIPDGSLSA